MNTNRWQPIYLIMLFVSCSSIHVKTDYNKQYDFSGIHSYRWFHAQAKEDILDENPILRNRILSEIK
jgi:hypothetical protein